MATWYLSLNGDDNNNGSTPATAIKTFPRLAQLVRGGDTAYIAPGEYIETTHGSFVLVNSGTDATTTRIIGDTTGTAFGVAPGEVVIQRNYNSGANAFIEHAGNIRGTHIYENIRFDKFRVNASTSVYGSGVLLVKNDVSTTIALRITMRNCVFSNIRLVTANSGNTGTVARWAPRLNSDSLTFEKCQFTVESALATVSPIIQGFAYTGTYVGLYGAKADAGGINFNGCTFKTLSTFLSTHKASIIDVSVSTAQTSPIMTFNDCEIGKNDEGGLLEIWLTSFHYAVVFNRTYARLVRFNVGTLASVDVNNSYLEVTSGSLQANNAMLNAERSTLIGTVLTSSGTNSLILKNCLYTSSDLSGLSTSYQSIVSVIAKDSVFFKPNAFGIQSYMTTLERVVLAGKGFTSSSTTNIFSVGSLFPRLNNISAWGDTNAPFNSGSTSTSNGSVGFYNRFITQSNGNTGASYFGSGVAYINQTRIPTYDYPVDLPDVLLPEYKNPLSGRVSAYIPVAYVGAGRMRVILEGGQANTITVSLKKSWTGGKLFARINGQVVGEATETTALQNMVCTFTPKTTDAYDLEIIGIDAYTASDATDLPTTTTDQNNYVMKRIDIDTIAVS